VVQFADWLNAPVLQRQRLQDNARDHRLKTYYHWIRDGVDFINLDNASPEQFDEAQINWLGRVVADDSKPNSTVTTIVVGMHEALPDSLAWFHSMNNAPAAEQSGRRAYEILLQAQQKAQKRVYVLASHSHFFMDGIFNTEALQKRGAVLPGWIVGTAGAVRHALPADASRAHAAASNVYGYLLATVTREQSPGTIGFQFREIKEGDVPASVVAEFGAPLVHSCFSGNSQQTHSQ
jgi:hypothetical protein